MVAALALGVMGLGCSNKGGTSPGGSSGASAQPAASEWRVGVFASLSGPQTQFGQETREGIELAMDQVNKEGGIKGRPVKLLVEDDKSNPQEATNKVLQLIDRDKAVALLGEVQSSISKAAGIIASRKKIPMISPSSTNLDVTKVGPFVFRACFTDDAQGPAGARFIARTLQKKRVAILFASDDLYSSGLAKDFRDEAKKLGLEVVAEKGFLKNETNFTTYITELRDAKPDLIYAPIYYDAMTRVARQAKAAGVKGEMFLGGDGWDSPALLKDAAEDLEGAYLTDHFAPDVPLPSSQAFVKAYRDRHQHDPSSLAATAYDAARILADAMERAKGDSPEAIRDAIADTKGFMGATGSITINAERNADKPIVIVQIKDRRFTYHSTIDAKAN
jgi:branched-chain amino acid transport system substrate-binding protein